MNEKREWDSLADVLARLSEKNLLARCTSIKVGGIEVQMLPAAPEAAGDQHRREREAEQEHNDTLFGSS